MKQTIILIEIEKIFVGHNRLSIMDPEYGRQPLLSDDKEIIVAAIIVRFTINLI